MQHGENVSLHQRLLFAKDIANGILYIHKSEPPIIHYDLRGKAEGREGMEELWIEEGREEKRGKKEEERRTINEQEEGAKRTVSSM